MTNALTVAITAARYGYDCGKLRQSLWLAMAVTVACHGNHSRSGKLRQSLQLAAAFRACRARAATFGVECNPHVYLSSSSTL